MFRSKNRLPLSRISVVLLLTSAALTACGGAGSPGPAPGTSAYTAEIAGAARRRHLVILSIDPLRADRLGTYGYAERDNSPSIDALLKRGRIFARATAPRALTWPSLASVMTGLYPRHHEVFRNGYGFLKDQATLAKSLSAAGYETAAFLSNMCQANHQGLEILECNEGDDRKTIDAVLAWLSGRDEDRPMFLWVHLWGAHQPYYNGGDRVRRVLDPDYIGPVVAGQNELFEIMQKRRVLTPRDLRHLNAMYDASIQGTDEFVDEFLSGLDRRKVLRDGVLVFLSDHGEELYDHNQYIFHSCSIYQSTLHVPLAIVAEGILRPGLFEANVELIDVAPTLLDLMGLPAFPASDGISLTAFLADSPGGAFDKPAYSEYENTKLRTVQLGDWKLVDNPNEYYPSCVLDVPRDFYPIGKTELYNLATDPNERNDLSAAQPERVAELRALIARRFENIELDAEGQVLSEAMKERLRALGYIAE